MGDKMKATNGDLSVEGLVEEEEDPLEAYMKGIEAEVRKIDYSTAVNEAKRKRKADDAELERVQAKVNGFVENANAAPSDDEEVDEFDPNLAGSAQKKSRKKDLAQVDHSQIDYPPFRKGFYIETPEIAKMTEEEIKEFREDVLGVKIRGIDCPKPIKKWSQCGVPVRILDVVKKNKYEYPTAIQAQAIPAIMSGRDVIGVAKTGSGKTLAFLLPMFRHIMDQPALRTGDGPIAVLMTPTRELAQQTYSECRKFARPLGLRVVCAYGGSAIAEQIADLKRGTEVIVCTPGRMIDLLTANSGRVINLRRTTYLVLDEADRMFDMGFEPQVMRIVNNIRPDRQTVMFSATFPRQMEALARRVLDKPLEIVVGGRSIVCEDVQQIVEVREEGTKFFRLLEILGLWYKAETRVLIFVDRQEAADNLLKELLRKGYSCLSLHGGKDQNDRDCTIADFKNGVCNILIATSVAARGLDVKNLGLVINYECPNHLEDYVHRCGRTGRAGNKGTAFTFITPEQDKYAGDIIKALEMSQQPVPKELSSLWEEFQQKVKAGLATHHGSGFGGKGLERIEQDRAMVLKTQKKSFGVEEEEEEEEEIVNPEGEAEEAEGGVESGPAGGTKMPTLSSNSLSALRAAQAAAASISAAVGINARFARPLVESSALFHSEVEINDYPQQARWKITHKEQLRQITEFTGASISTRGTYIAPGKTSREGERKLFLSIDGDSLRAVELATAEVRRVLDEISHRIADDVPKKQSRYSVV